MQIPMTDILKLIDDSTYEVKEALTEGQSGYSFKAKHRLYNKDVFLKIIERVSTLFASSAISFGDSNLEQ